MLLTLEFLLSVNISGQTGVLFVNKKISKAIMDRTRLRRNRFLRTRSNGDTEAYNK